jgi:hypothetical protein
MGGKTMRLLMVVMLAVSPMARGDGPGRIYTKLEDADSGVMSGKVSGSKLTHAIAVERDRKRVYLAAIAGGGTGFHFEKLPAGRFDLVLVTSDNRVVEGVGLGAETKLTDDRAKHLKEGVAKADSFFNRHQIHRIGVGEGFVLVFAERIRDGVILRGSGEKIDACLRRLEIIELREAEDEWQMVGTRHLYREETPQIKGIPFLSHIHLPALGGLRLAGTPKDLGIIDLPKIHTP